DAMIRQAVGSPNAEARQKIARFYIRASRYDLAHRELESIGHDFPQLAKEVQEADVLLVRSRAQELVSELKLRPDPRQHQFVSAACRRIEAGEAFSLESVSAAVRREVREIAAKYEAAREQAAHATALMAELQAQLSSDDQRNVVGPIRTEIAEKLSYAN